MLELPEPGRLTDQPLARMDNDPHSVLEELRQRIQSATTEYAAGNLNAPQFRAIHRHYTEKRLIIEQLIARNADSSAWKAVATPGHTGFLRDHFEARPLYYVVFRRGETRPLRSEGRLPRFIAQQLYRMLQAFWSMTQWRTGLARKSLGKGYWLLMNVGENSLTMIVYMFEPSALQVQHVRDLHADFERANARQLEQDAPPERFVFPQRSLLQGSTG